MCFSRPAKIVIVLKACVKSHNAVFIGRHFWYWNFYINLGSIFYFQFKGVVTDHVYSVAPSNKQDSKY